MARTPLSDVRRLMAILDGDLPRLTLIDNYIHGIHADPYVPDNASAEYKLLAKRAVTNWFPLVVGASAQSLYVDSVRPGRKIPQGARDVLPEWKHWQLSRLDSRQTAIYREALGFGHAFAVTERRGGKIQTKGLSALSTSALFADPANDETPKAAFTVVEWPSAANEGVGIARLWNETNEYEVLFQGLLDGENVVINDLGPHGSSFCPVTRFAAYVDLSGRTFGVVEPLLALHDRINQTVFDTLVVQSGGAFKVRYATGMEQPYKMHQVEQDDGSFAWEPLLDEDGTPIPDEIRINALELLFSPGENTKFGTLDETPLDGYLKAIEEAVKAFAAISQTPPHYLLGSIVNLSAEALQAAETSLERKVGEFRSTFGESWERVFRLSAELNEIEGATDDYQIEVIWRDMEARALGPTADGLLKLRQMGAPLKGLIQLVPGMTLTQFYEWVDMIDAEAEEDPTAQLASATSRNATARSTVATRRSTSTNGLASTGVADQVP